MINNPQTDMKRYWIRKAAKFLVFAIVFVALIGWLVMTLWNRLLPPILGVSTVTFWQALGLLVLSRILFGGWGRGGGGGWGGPRNRHWREKMAERWQSLTPEQREQMREKMKNRWKHCDKS